MKAINNGNKQVVTSLNTDSHFTVIPIGNGKMNNKNRILSQRIVRNNYCGTFLNDYDKALCFKSKVDLRSTKILSGYLPYKVNGRVFFSNTRLNWVRVIT